MNPSDKMGANGAGDQPEMTPQQEDQILDNVEEAAGEAPTHEADEMLNDEVDIVNTLEQKLDTVQAALDKEKKEYLFLMAEFDNYRKRTVKERAELIKNASEGAMKDLLPIVDDMERGLEATKDVSDPASIREGMELIYQKLVKLLERNGVKAIESTGKPFDPDTQEAIAMVPVTDDAQKGVVIDTPTKGYMINDKVLRHAKVAVGQ
ncbi:MAG: nucleotide exchange factor GrpE [Candidatus Amulumruptor caecigallinarius]|nr:nucleotide exchange factor GrpE [Candidatus Amulumruptor caecigallinarius]MCM1396824.1 nucleotide exchange factor GrpE [Candidatus Amulumruptor caecigallinarius]MCM1454232.1 nucleotide exchange factor GrpE [bacterium]